MRGWWCLLETRGLFKHQLTSVYRRSKLNLKMSFETQSFKTQIKKNDKSCLYCLESLIYSFFAFRIHQQCKKSVQKKLQSREQNVCARQMSFSATFVLNKITEPIFQIIHIQNKTLNHCVNSQSRSWMKA